MRPSLPPHIVATPGSGIRRIFEIALHMDPQPIMLAVGEPDQPVAEHIRAAAQEAWERDDTNYTPNGGLAVLRDAIVAKLAAVNGITAEREQVWVTNGGVQALYQALTLTLAAGDEVLVPDPGYTTFTMGAHMLDAAPVPYTLLPENDFLPDFDALERSVTDRTRVLIVNSPSNPLGRVFPADVVEQLVRFAERHDLWLISDEVYEHFTYGEAHASAATFDTDGRVFTVFSLSKTYAMTGVRVGYLVTPFVLPTTMQAVQEATVSCIDTPAQYAALAAITGPQDAVDVAREHYRENLEAALAELEGTGIRSLAPKGAFYLWIDVSHASGGDVAAWCEHFLSTQDVAVAPGSAFGASGEGWIRICLAAELDDIREGLRRLPRL